MSSWVYAIRSKTTGKIYIGQSDNPERRLGRHNTPEINKPTSYTRKNKGPWELVYQEKIATRREAVRREKQLKSARGRKFIKSVKGP